MDWKALGKAILVFLAILLGFSFVAGIIYLFPMIVILIVGAIIAVVSFVGCIYGLYKSFKDSP